MANKSAKLSLNTWNHIAVEIDRTINKAKVWINGLLDDVRIYNTSLTASEIQKLYVQGLEKHRDLAGG